MCRNAGKKVVATRGIKGKETCSSEPRRWNRQALALGWTRRGCEMSWWIWGAPNAVVGELLRAGETPAQGPGHQPRLGSSQQLR